jgi:hypothetical protein
MIGRTSMFSVAFMLVVTIAKADPIRVLPGSFVSLTPGTAHSGVFTIAAAGISISTDEAEDDTFSLALPPMPLLRSGAIANASSVVGLGNGENGCCPFSGLLSDGRTVIVTGPLAFDAPDARLTCSTSGGVTRCTARSGFVLSGNLTATDPATHAVLFTREITGTGVASGAFDNDAGRASNRQLTYNFGLSPTPEPTTLLLLGAGLAAACGFRRRLRRA